jgi:hypothetical protein
LIGIDYNNFFKTSYIIREGGGGFGWWIKIGMN